MGVHRLIILVGFLASTAALGAVDKLQIVGLFPGKAIIEIDGRRRVIAAGDVSPEGVKLISATSQAAVLEIDGRVASYPLGGRIGNRFVERRAPTSVRIWPDPQGMYTVDGSINAIPVNFIVDTGATHVALSEREARRLGLDYRVAGTEGTVTTASGVVRSFSVRLNKVRVGAIELLDVPATVVDGDFPSVTLLGMSFLGRVDMLRDGRVMELRTR